MRAASIKTLVSELDLDQSKAKDIRAIWHAESLEQLEEIDAHWYQSVTAQLYRLDLDHVKRLMIDKILNTHGVEYLGTSFGSGDCVHYCNAGDTYATTIIFNGNNLIVSNWGDMVERDQVDYGQWD